MKRQVALLLVLVTLSGILFGCGTEKIEKEEPVAETTTIPEETLPPVPGDGNPGDVTCKGTYSGAEDMNAVVAAVGQGELTNAQLQAWYWAAVASYREEGAGEMPDFAIPLDRQSCPIDDTVNSWQQYFLKVALNNWHTAQALYELGELNGLPVEAAFQPESVAEYREENLVDIPAVKYLYRENRNFVPNTMHQAWLDDIPKLLDTIAKEQGWADGSELAKEAFGTTKDALADMIKDYNWGYMYDTNLSYYIEVAEDEIISWYEEHKAEYAQLGIGEESGNYVSFRQILLIPEESEDYPGLTVEIAGDGTVTCDEALWDACMEYAEDIITKWAKYKRGRTEAAFADFAVNYSMDVSSSLDGGAFHRVEKGQMIAPIDEWIFEEGRENRDYTVVRSRYGLHILCYGSDTPIWYAQSQQDLTAQKQRELILSAREGYPMTVTYSAVHLAETGSGVPMERLLYEDLAHERFPEIPLYLQQDYPKTMYGNYRIRYHGCGITSYAMLASYLTDEELTPPEMCAEYGRYSMEAGTDITLFMYEPPAMGFYGKVIYDPDDALQALKDGYPVISVQRAGYWTRGGHYIVCEKYNEDGTIQVRDSNLFNYGKLEDHKRDAHEWSSITPASKVYMSFNKKITRIPLCYRCGDGQQQMLESEYLCHKCRPALLRRDTYLSVIG